MQSLIAAPAASVLPTIVILVVLLISHVVPSDSSTVRDDLYDAAYIADAAAVRALLESTSSEIISSRPPVRLFAFTETIEIVILSFHCFIYFADSFFFLC